MKVAHLLVFGFVQGVGYRKFVQKEARKLGLVGWVRNLPEGTVEAEISGSEDKIEELVLLCKKGPSLSEVKAVDVEWQEKDVEYKEFVLRHDID